MKKNKIVLISTILVFLWLCMFNQPSIPIEGVDIAIGAGGDIIKKNGKITFSLPVIFYEFSEKDKVSSMIHKNYARTLGETRQARQLRANKKFSIGNEKIHIWSEAFARYGLKNVIDVLFENPFVNNTAPIIICKGKSINILEKKVPAYPSSADYLLGVITNSTSQNFLSNEYSLINTFVRMDSEGKSIVLPYISITNNELSFDGMALFNKDKMVAKINIGESRVMNMLREKNSSGLLTLYKSPRNYINFHSTVAKKVKCNKINGKFIFTISLDIKGVVIINERYKKLYNNPMEIKKFTNDMSNHVKQISYSFLKKMQKKYKVDCLELGQFAIAKYGRHAGINWNKAVSNSKIIVKTNITIDRVTRGKY
jgi:Ger(x)C family germination protein